MDRRKIMATVLAIGSGTFLFRRSAQAEAVQPASSGVPKIVYHLADIDKVPFVMGNVKNHIIGMGGPDKVKIAVVTHGPSLAAFRLDAKDQTMVTDAKQLLEKNVAFFACINTMNAMKITLNDLPPGFGVADKGGVVKLAELQADGWLYLRP